MKKSIATLLLASFIVTNISPAACLAIGNKDSKEPKKVSITKTHKQRAKSDSFKYEYINYDWWNNFNDDILNGYIDLAIKNKEKSQFMRLLKCTLSIKNNTQYNIN